MRKKAIEAIEFGLLFMFIVAVIIFGFYLHTAYGQVVAGIDANKAAKVLKNEDIELMAHLVNAENATYSSRMKTGSVVLNRVKSKKFPSTIRKVIFQRGQYACTWDGNFEKKPDKMAYKVAKKLIKEGSVLPRKVLYAAEFKQGKVYCRDDGTYYCY